MSSWQSSEPYARFGAELSKGFFAKITEDYILGELKDRWSMDMYRWSLKLNWPQMTDLRQPTAYSLKDSSVTLRYVGFFLPTILFRGTT